MKSSRPGLERCVHTRMVPDIIPNGAQLLTNAGIVAALRPQLSFQHVVFEAQLRTISSTVQKDDPGGGIKPEVDTGDDDVPTDGSGLALVRAAPIEQPQAQHQFNDLPLLA